MRRRTEDYIVIILAGILILIVVVMIAISFQGAQQEKTAPTGTATLTPTTPPPAADPPAIDVKTSWRMWDKVANKPALAPADNTAKKNTITAILHGIDSGILYESPRVRVEYVKSLDIFLAEVTTVELSLAKAEVNSWLRVQGLSQEAICNLPIIFYINLETAESLRGQNVLFRPAIQGC